MQNITTVQFLSSWVFPYSVMCESCKWQQNLWQSTVVTTHLYVATVVAPGRELDPAEGDGALEGHLDGCLLHPILSVGPWGARDGSAAEIPLY